MNPTLSPGGLPARVVPLAALLLLVHCTENQVPSTAFVASGSDGGGFTNEGGPFPLDGSFADLADGAQSEAGVLPKADGSAGTGGTTDGGTSTDGSPSSPADGGADGASTGSPLTFGKAPYTLVYATSPGGIDMRTASEASFTTAGLERYKANDNELPSLGSLQNENVNIDAFLIVGRWSGGTSGGKFYNVGGTGLFSIPTNGGFHYAIGNGLDPLPSLGKVTYGLSRATPVTVGDGTRTPGTATGKLGAVFAGGSSKVGWSVTLDVPGDATYTLETQGGATTPATSEAQWAGTIKGAFFGNLTVTSSGEACQGGATCTGSVRGFVAGPNAERIALAVHVYPGGGGSAKSVSSVLVFSKP